MRINSLPVSPLSSTVADFLSFLYGTANDLLLSQRLTTSTSRKDRAGNGIKPSGAARGMKGSGMSKPTPSSGHSRSDIHFDDLNYRHRPYDSWEAYGQSKTANALFAVGLTRHVGNQGITANAINPGVIATGLQRNLSLEDLCFEHIYPRYYEQGSVCFFFASSRGRIQMTAKLTAKPTNVSEKLRTRANRVRLVETSEGSGKRQRTSKFELSVRP